jgi:flagellar hook-associated protein 1 FlgK
MFDFAFNTTTFGSKDRFASPDGLPTTADLSDILANTDVTNFTSRLQLTSADPRTIAAALDASGGAATAIYSAGDGRNLLALSALQSRAMSLSDGVAGGFSLNATYTAAYNESVGYIGDLRSSSDVGLSVARDNATTATKKRDEVSSVSIDEEFTALITHQKAYQASASMIRTADKLLEQVLQLL